MVACTHSAKNTFLLEQGQQRAIPGGSDALHRQPTSRFPAQPSAPPRRTARSAPDRVNADNRRPSASSAPRRRRRRRRRRGGPPANGRLLTPSPGAAAWPGGPGRGRDRSDGGGRPELRPCAAAGGAARHHALPARRLREPPPPLPASRAQPCPMASPAAAGPGAALPPGATRRDFYWLRSFIAGGGCSLAGLPREGSRGAGPGAARRRSLPCQWPRCSCCPEGRPLGRRGARFFPFFFSPFFPNVLTQVSRYRRVCEEQRRAPGSRWLRSPDPRWGARGRRVIRVPTLSRLLLSRLRCREAGTTRDGSLANTTPRY